MAVVVSGAPGAGKSTLGALLAESMSLPHLNKDITMRSLRRSRIPTEIANKQAFEIVYGTAQQWISLGVSMVMDMTMYPDYSVGEVQSLLSFGLVVNVHCRAANAVDRWEYKVRRHVGERAEAEIERLRWVHEVATEPLDFGCPRLEVDTTDGYEPEINQLITSIERLHTQYLQATSSQ